MNILAVGVPVNDTAEIMGKSVGDGFSIALDLTNECNLVWWRYGGRRHQVEMPACAASRSPSAGETVTASAFVSLRAGRTTIYQFDTTDTGANITCMNSWASAGPISGWAFISTDISPTKR